MRCTALLCRAILRPFKYGCSHVDSRCGHMSLSLRWHSVQLGLRCVRGQNMVFLWLPMYCILCTIMPQTISLSTLTLLYVWYEESIPVIGMHPLQ